MNDAGKALLLAGLLVSGTCIAAQGPYAQAALEALRRSDCQVAIDNLNKGITAKEADAFFWAGRFLDTGACVGRDKPQAAEMFNAAVILGNERARIELGGKIGLGVGFPQSYEKAGEIFRSAGIDGQKRSNLYSLGYAGTLRAAAADDMFARLPSDLVQAGFSGEIFVDFQPASGKINVRLGPQFAMRVDSRTGSNLRRSRVEVLDVVEEAWSDAMKVVPKPDAGRLDNEVVTIPITIDAESTPIQQGASSLFNFRLFSPTKGASP